MKFKTGQYVEIVVVENGFSVTPNHTVSANAVRPTGEGEFIFETIEGLFKFLDDLLVEEK
jgi:hypothetical protein